jgi:site-specific recombinase XerD
MTTEIDQLKRQFLEYLEIEKGSALRTVENYEHYLTRYFEIGKIKKAEDITEPSVREFRLWLNRQITGNNRKTGDTMSKKTQNYYMIALRVFLKFLIKRGIKSISPEQIELAKVGERSLDLITSEELGKLLNSPNGTSLKDLRDKAILELLFSTGLRVSELCSLGSDINLHADELSIRGKGGKVRVVFLSDNAKKAINNYLSARKEISDALFTQIPNKNISSKPDSKGKKSSNLTFEKALTRRSIERIVKQHAIKTGISKKVTPHIMRHMFATDLLGNGADLRSVQMMLGHSNIATTQIYTHVTDKQLRDVHKKFHSRK